MAEKNLYLIAYYSAKPKHTRVKTHIKGWMNDKDNVAYDEQIAVTTKIKNKDIAMAKIILDIKNEKIIRDGWQTGQEYYELYSHFYKQYKREIDSAVNQLGINKVEQPSEVPAKLDTNATISSV